MSSGTRTMRERGPAGTASAADDVLAGASAGGGGGEGEGEGEEGREEQRRRREQQRETFAFAAAAAATRPPPPPPVPLAAPALLLVPPWAATARPLLLPVLAGASFHSPLPELLLLGPRGGCCCSWRGPGRRAVGVG